MSIIEFVGTTEVPKFDHARRRLPSPDGAGFTLTLVSDTSHLVDSLAPKFVAYGWNVMKSQSVEDALSVVQCVVPTVVVCDLAMQGMRGYDIAESVRTRFGELSPILVALSGRSDQEVTQAAMTAGFSAVLPKPPDFEQLKSVIRLGMMGRSI